MQPATPGTARSQGRAPGGFSPLSASSNSTGESSPRPLQLPSSRIDSSFSAATAAAAIASDDSLPSIAVPKTRQQSQSVSGQGQGQGQQSGPSQSGAVAAAAAAHPPATPIYQQFVSHANLNASSPTPTVPRSGAPRTGVQSASSPSHKTHSRKHATTQGMFEPTLPSTSTSNLSQVGLAMTGGASPAMPSSSTSSATLSANQIAVQAAVAASHQNAVHSRQRSSTVPFPGDTDASRRATGPKGPMSPPMLSLTEASAPRESGFAAMAGPSHDARHHPSSSGHSSAATAAANVVFPRSGQSSPREPSVSPQPPPLLNAITTAATITTSANITTTTAAAAVAAASSTPHAPPAEKPLSKSEKAKTKLFSRPGKIGTKGDVKEKALPSPGKIGTALSALQRGGGNFSANNLAEPGSSHQLYTLSNSSSATIRPLETGVEEKGKEKEKKHHHFLSRQKQKLKDDYHLALSSAASNSRPTDPNAPSSLYNFSVPPSPGPSSSTFSKAKKDKKHAERSDSRVDSEPSHSHPTDWPGSSSLPSLSQQVSALSDATDAGRSTAGNNVSMDDAWPYLKAKLLVIFQGEDLRLPIEDINRVVQAHIQWCVHKRSPNAMLEDLRDLLAMGFSTMDRTLRKTAEDRFIPTLVELWLFTFTSILPYMQAAFLPLDLEVSGCGSIMTAEQARDFWGGVVAVVAPSSAAAAASSDQAAARVMPAATVLDVRRLVLTAYRDIVMLPRYETLKTIFSRLSLEFLPSAFASMALASPPVDSSLSTSPSDTFSPLARPGTAMSMDPSVGSYNSTSTTLLGDGSAGGRSRAVSNVSMGSRGSDGVINIINNNNNNNNNNSAVRPFTPSGAQVQVLSSVREREQNVEDSKQVTDMVGRMLQCMSVLSSLGGMGSDANDEGNKKMVELCKMLKLNWLGRGRTGRNRMGIVGGRVRRDEVREELRVA